jgi:hypothetical protein
MNKFIGIWNIEKVTKININWDRDWNWNFVEFSEIKNFD